MFKGILVFVLSITLIITSCKEKETANNISTDKIDEIKVVEDKPKETDVKVQKKSTSEPPKGFVEIVNDSLGIILDIKYATPDNFTKKQIYECGRCFMRKEAAEKIYAIQKELKERYGFGLKLFDCYRPSPYQQKLWDAVPDPSYVTPPNKGSVHSRGLAIDLTIVDKKNKELDMGTKYDFFGKEAHTDNDDLPTEVLKNRQLLKKIMALHSFKGIRTEWWHFSMVGVKYGLADWIWDCE